MVNKEELTYLRCFEKDGPETWIGYTCMSVELLATVLLYGQQTIFINSVTIKGLQRGADIESLILS